MRDSSGNSANIRERSPSDDTRRANLLAYVAKVLSMEIELDRLLPRIVAYATEVLAADRSSLFLYDEKTDELWGRVAEGLGSREIRFPADRGLAGAVLASGRPMVVDDAYEHPRFDRHWDRRTGYRTRSVLATPIVNRKQEVLGVIQALNKRGGGDFTVADIRLAEAFGAHVAMALERAMLAEAYADRQKIQAMLDLARDVQRSLLPDSAAILDAVDISAYLAPAEIVAGDLYDWFEADTGRLGFAVGDVSGKGMPAALHMAGVQAMLRGFGRQGLPPASCLDLINRTRRGKASVFTSLVYGVLDTRSGRVDYANAGHCPPILLRPEQPPRVLDRAGQLPLGSVQRAYAQRSEQLQPGDCLLLYTDGVLEARAGDGELFGEARLLEAVRPMNGEPAETVVHGVLAAVEAFAGLGDPSDDLTVLALRWR